MSLAETHTSQSFTIEKAHLIAERLVARRMINQYAMTGMNISTYMPETVEGMIVEMHRLIFYQRGRTLHVPATWFDHLKDALKKHPRTPRWVKDRLTVRVVAHEARNYVPGVLPQRPPYNHNVAVFTALKEN